MFEQKIYTIYLCLSFFYPSIKPSNMNIHFNFHGSTYNAGLAKQGDNKLEVLIKDDVLEKQFGHSLPFYIQNKSVNFDTYNRSHSDLYALNASISKAIVEQCSEILESSN